MTLQINLPIAVETALLARAAAEGKDVSTIIVEVMTERFSDELPAESPDHCQVASPDKFRNRLRALIASHGILRGAFDDSRESIYAGRGE